MYITEWLGGVAVVVAAAVMRMVMEREGEGEREGAAVVAASGVVLQREGADGVVMMCVVAAAVAVVMVGRSKADHAACSGGGCGQARTPPSIQAAAAIAQLGERQTEDLKVPGSIPGLGISHALGAWRLHHT